MDLRLPLEEVSWSWRIAFVLGCVAGILLAKAFDAAAELGAVLSSLGGLSVALAYWLSQHRQRSRRGAGWYPTAGEPGVLRWWDGERWTEQRAVKAPQGAGDSPSSDRPFQSIWSMVLLVVFLASFFVPWSRARLLGEVLSYVVPLSLAYGILAIEHARRPRRVVPPPT